MQARTDSSPLRSKNTNLTVKKCLFVVLSPFLSFFASVGFDGSVGSDSSVGSDGSFGSNSSVGLLALIVQLSPLWWLT